MLVDGGVKTSALAAAAAAAALQYRFWQRFFNQMFEYFSKEALDVLMCISARAEVVRHPEPRPSQVGTRC